MQDTMNQAVGGAQQQSLTHELNLIPMVLELVEMIPSCGDQQQDITRKVASFRARLQSCREMLSKQQGLETSLGEQDKELTFLRNQLKCKQELLEKFSSLEVVASNLTKKETV